MARETLELTSELLIQYPARITGTRGCVAAGEAIRNYLGLYCHRTTLEPFKIHPEQLWNVGRIFALAYTLSLGLLFIGMIGVYIASIVCLIGLTFAIVHYIFFGELFDCFFPSKQAYNISGIIEPQERVTQQFIVVGHHDSPYVFRFLLRFQRLFGLRLLSGIIAYGVGLILILFWSTYQLLIGIPPEGVGLIKVTFAVGLLFVGPIFFFIKRTPSPGAGDNLLASVLTIKVAQFFDAHSFSRRHSLIHTRLILVSTDSEEIGQRGAKAFVEKHKERLLSLPTYVLNVDSVYRLQDLSVVLRDRNGTISLSHEMAKDCLMLARELGYDIKPVTIPFGGGGTDASEFATHGVNATSIIGMPTSLIRSGLVYHTPYDTVDHLDPLAVLSVLEIVINYIMRIDRALPKKAHDQFP